MFKLFLGMQIGNFKKVISFVYFWLWWVFIVSWTFLCLQQVGLLCSCSEEASHCSGFSCCGAWASWLARLNSCVSGSLEHRLNSCGIWV